MHIHKSLISFFQVQDKVLALLGCLSIAAGNLANVASSVHDLSPSRILDIPEGYIWTRISSPYSKIRINYGPLIKD